MKFFKSFAILLICLVLMSALSSCTGPSVTRELFYEIRAQKSLTFDPMISLDLVTDHSASGSRLYLTKRRDDADFAIFSASTLIFSNERRRAMIISPDGQPSQVFRLSIPTYPWPADWTQWQLPSYIETNKNGSAATWTFMDNVKAASRSTNIPPNCFEFRYKIEEWKH